MSGPLIMAYDIECFDHGQVGNRGGYGTAYALTESGRKRVFAHRLAFEAWYGYRPEVVMHICDNPRCIDPRHLQPGTQAKNNADRSRKGRSAKAVPARRVITQEQARDIRRRYVAYPKGQGRGKPGTIHSLAQEYGVDDNTIRNIVTGKTHREDVAA